MSPVDTVTLVENIVAGVIAVAVIGYLIVALLHPERTDV